MPFLTSHDLTGEAEHLATFAQHQADQIAATIHDLDHEQIARTPSASAMSLGALARHARLMIEGMTLRVQAAPEKAVSPERSPEQAGAEGAIEPSALRAADTGATLASALREAGAAFADAVGAADPSTPAPIPPAPWFPTEGQWSVRWMSLHLTEELARHAGHADVIRESLDGKGAYELNARADGDPWPPAWGTDE